MSESRSAIRSELTAILQIGSIFAAVGAVVGLLRGDGILFGAAVGLLFYGVAFGIERFALVALLRR
jgi:hypothetical protein